MTWGSSLGSADAEGTERKGIVAEYNGQHFFKLNVLQD